MSDEPKIQEPRRGDYALDSLYFDDLRKYIDLLRTELATEKHQRSEDEITYKSDVERQERQLDEIARELGLPQEARKIAGCDVLAHYARDTVINYRRLQFSVEELKAENARLSREIERLREDAEKWRAYVKAHQIDVNRCVFKAETAAAPKDDK